MSTVAERQWTYDELAGAMAQDIHAHIHNNGPDRREYWLAIPCAAFPLEKRKAMWEAAYKQIEEVKAKPAGAFRRYIPQSSPEPSSKSWVIDNHLAKRKEPASSFLPEPQPTAESSSQHIQERFRFDEELPLSPKAHQWTAPRPSPAIGFTKMAHSQHTATMRNGGSGMDGSTKPRLTNGSRR